MNAPDVIAPDRTKFIGGSDIGAILGISPWKTATDLWISKTRPQVEDERNAAAKRRGNRLEPYIFSMIEDEYGFEIEARNERYVDADVPYFACEIDAEATGDDLYTENIEVKTVHPFKAAEWGELDTDQLPLHYVAQVQWGLGITRRQRCHVFALIGDDLRHYAVERDDETIEALRSKAVEFWTRYVLAKLPPPIDFNDARSIASLRRLYPGTDGSEIEATEAQQHWREILKSAEEKRDLYQGVVDGAKAHLLAEMGSAALLRFPDGKAYRRKEISKKAYTVEYAATKYIDFRLVTDKEPA